MVVYEGQESIWPEVNKSCKRFKKGIREALIIPLNWACAS
jgi:hypothetical protein